MMNILKYYISFILFLAVGSMIPASYSRIFALIVIAIVAFAILYGVLDRIIDISKITIVVLIVISIAIGYFSVSIMIKYGTRSAPVENFYD